MANQSVVQLKSVRPLSAAEWGRQQALASPLWSEEKWKRVAVILHIQFVPVTANDKKAA